MQHNAHPRSLVHTPWRPDTSQNRQGSRAHPETPRNTPKRPKTCRPEDGDCLVEVGAVGQFSFYRSWHHQNFCRVGWGPHRHNSQIPNSARANRQNCQTRDGLILATRCAQERSMSTKRSRQKRSIVAEIAPISISRRF